MDLSGPTSQAPTIAKRFKDADPDSTFHTMSPQHRQHAHIRQPHEKEALRPTTETKDDEQARVVNLPTDPKLVILVIIAIGLSTFGKTLGAFFGFVVVRCFLGCAVMAWRTPQQRERIGRNYCQAHSGATGGIHCNHTTAEHLYYEWTDFTEQHWLCMSLIAASRLGLLAIIELQVAACLVCVPVSVIEVKMNRTLSNRARRRMHARAVVGVGGLGARSDCVLSVKRTYRM